jgi:MFS transporter, PAT family, beta-lactamase induction signal transducer AmpG
LRKINFPCETGETVASGVLSSKALRLTMVTVLGFASGLPLALSGTALQTWLTIDNVDITTIGFFSLVGLPYTFKFLWAPLMDRFEPTSFGRRRGWLFLVQFSLALVLALMSSFSPSKQTQFVAMTALLIAFLSASQDIVIDAYRTDILRPEERGLGSSLSVFGYRVAMILSGGIALVWADAASGYGWSWPDIYRVMSGIMLVLAVITPTLLPSVPGGAASKPRSVAKNDLIGFTALVAVVGLGYLLTAKGFTPVFQYVGDWLVGDDNLDHYNVKKWMDLISLLLGLAVTIPLGWWVSVRAKFETLNVSLGNYFKMPGALSILILIILYKVGDAFAGSLTSPFLIKGMGFSQAEIGVVNKVIGIWLTILGALVGGLFMVRLGLFWSLLLFGILQMLSNLGFWLVAVLGKNAWGTALMPAFDLGFVSLKESTGLDLLLVSAIGFENITGGMGTAAFVALLMALCNQKFTATQYALLSAFAAIGRVWVGPMAGVLATTLGWPSFFVFSTIAAIPGLVMLWSLKSVVKNLDAPKEVSLLDD